MYTKTTASENKEVYSRAKALLNGETGLAREYLDIIDTLCDEFPNVPKNRIERRVVKALRTNKAAEVRNRRK